MHIDFVIFCKYYCGLFSHLWVHLYSFFVCSLGRVILYCVPQWAKIKKPRQCIFAKQWYTKWNWIPQSTMHLSGKSYLILFVSKEIVISGVSKESRNLLVSVEIILHVFLSLIQIPSLQGQRNPSKRKPQSLYTQNDWNTKWQSVCKCEKKMANGKFLHKHIKWSGSIWTISHRGQPTKNQSLTCANW